MFIFHRNYGEYFDTAIGLYYLRARHYDPTVGRFTQEDTHWNTANMIYGDNPQKINEREDALGLKTYSYAPQISAIIQSNNLYVYALNNPLLYLDPSGLAATDGELTGIFAWLQIGWTILEIIGSGFAIVSAISAVVALSATGLGVLVAASILFEAGIALAKGIYDTLALTQMIYYTIKYGGFAYTEYTVTGDAFYDFFLPSVIGNITKPRR